MHASILPLTIGYLLISYHSKFHYQTSICKFPPSELILSHFHVIYLPDPFLCLHTVSLESVSPNYLNIIFIGISYKPSQAKFRKKPLSPF
jgi:hypothetical protein